MFKRASSVDERGNATLGVHGAPRTLIAGKAPHSLIPGPVRFTTGAGHADRPDQERRPPNAASHSMMRNSTRKKRDARGGQRLRTKIKACYQVDGFGHNRVTFCIRKLKT